MKITVCVKQVPATNEIRMDPVTNTIIREGIESILNPFDTYAVEEAIRLKERFGKDGGWNLTSMSMGIPAAASILKETIALGFDEAYLLSDRALAGADTIATAKALTAGIRKTGMPDLILCGKMASDGDTAQVGPMVAEMLSIPHVTDIAEILDLKDGVLTCRRMTDDGYSTITIQLPALVTVVKEINVPRLPSIAGMLRGHSTEIPMIRADALDVSKEELGLSGSPTQVVRSFVPIRDRHCQILEGSDIAKADALLDVLIAQQLVHAEG